MLPRTRKTGTASIKPKTTRKLRRPPTPSKPNYTVLSWIGGFILLSLLGLGIRFCNKSVDNTDVRQEMHQVVAKFENYSKHGQYYDSLVDSCHDQAFENAYTIGGRRRANTLNEKAYLIEIMALMATKARNEGNMEVATSLDFFHERAQTLK